MSLKPESALKEVPLPPGWEKEVTNEGKVYYVDHINKKTSWIDPRAKNSRKKSSDLPVGWEEARTTDGATYYIDHNTQTTSWDHPAQRAKKHADKQSTVRFVMFMLLAVLFGVLAAVIQYQRVSQRSLSVDSILLQLDYAWKRHVMPQFRRYLDL